MKHKLSILICTIPSRAASFGRLITELRGQMLAYAPAVGIISNASTELSIGAKRNWLLEKAESDYIAFIDDDDMVSGNYIDLLMKAAASDCDCASLKGLITFDGKNGKIFEHSRRYLEWKTVHNKEVTYERFPNHLNMIRTSIAKQFKFPEKNHGEDYDWSHKLNDSGLLQKEFYIQEIIYFYRYLTKKPANELQSK